MIYSPGVGYIYVLRETGVKYKYVGTRLIYCVLPRQHMLCFTNLDTGLLEEFMDTDGFRDSPIDQEEAASKRT